MKTKFLIILIFIVCKALPVFGQHKDVEIRKYETFDIFLKEQSEKISKVRLGISLEDVEEIFGKSVRVQIPKVGQMKPLDKVFRQPEFKNVFKPKKPDEVIVLWYFTTPKDQNGYVSKNECTPIIFESNKVIGIGWDDFKKARKDGTLR